MSTTDHTQGGELRRNPVSGKLTIVAPARATRPLDAADGAGAAPDATPATTPARSAAVGST